MQSFGFDADPVCQLSRLRERMYYFSYRKGWNLGVSTSRLTGKTPMDGKRGSSQKLTELAQSQLV